MNMIRWRSLDPGEPIGVVALSGPVDPVAFEPGIEALRAWGHPIEFAPNVRARDRYLAGSDDLRLAGLDELLDRGVRTFIAARGGYGVTRLLDRLPWRRLKDLGARFVGFSDLTALTNPLAGSTVQIHGPMVAAGLSRPENADRLHDLLCGRLVGKGLFSFPPGAVLSHGRAEGNSMGGNLSLLSSLLGTPWEPDFTDAVLFLEEISEPAYRLDRLLTHLSSSKSFGGVNALIGGSLRGCRPASETNHVWSELLRKAAPEGVPVVVGLPFGHGARHLAFPLGALIDVDTGRGAVSWKM